MEKVNRKTDHELGEFIWSIVHNSKYSQEKLAEILDVSPRMISYYCSGQKKPTQRKLLRLIRVTGVNVEDIPL